MEYQQKVFTGGLNLLDDPSEIGDDQYRYLVNARQRFSSILPIKKATQLTLPFEGNYQGGVAVGNTIIVFISGRAYYQVGGTTAWIRISDFLMDATARRFWTVTVAKSTRDYVRQRNGSMNNPIIINTDFTVAGTPAGLVVQDGLTQPWLIQFNGTTQTFVARLTKNYSQWANISATADDREYVPIGKQMFILNQKLFIVAPDGRSIYHSVTGRPLDFMVNIDADGNKAITEAAGGAATVSFAFDGEDITAVQATNVVDTFLYATAKQVRLIQLDYLRTILGEPTYSQAQRITAGVVNDQSLIEILGDYAFIDNDGLKSFNSVENYQVEGKNSVFSAAISKLLEGRVQEADQAAAITFDNFAFFYCNTRFGKATMVYDTLRQRWTGIDLTELVDIKQFFVFANGTDNKLYAVSSNGVYQLFASEVSEMAQVHLKTLRPDDLKAEHKGVTVKPLFRGATQDGTLRVIEYVDEQYSFKADRTIVASIMAMTFPIFFPITFSSKPNSYNKTLNFDKGKIGKKLAYVILWNTDAALEAVKITTSEHDPDAGTRQTATG